MHREGVTQFALIAVTGPDYVTFWPVLLDSEMCDESALVAPVYPGLPVDFSVWPAIETGADIGVLDRRMSTVLPPDRMRELRRACREGDELPGDWVRGTGKAEWLREYVAKGAEFFATVPDLGT